MLPFGKWPDVMTVLHAIWPEMDLNLIQPTPQPDRARWLTPFSHSQHTWGVGEDVLVAHHGLIEHAMSIVPHRRMQSLSLHQGPVQRRLRLATIAVHTTDGPVSLRLYHLDRFGGTAAVRRAAGPWPRGPCRRRGRLIRKPPPSPVALTLRFRA